MKGRTGKARAAKTKHPAVAARAEPKRSAALAPCASFAVVGIGASAGGLEAFTQLLEHLPPNSGMAFAFIQHLSPTHPSLLGEALSRATRMPVLQVTHRMRVEPDHVYVIPPNTEMEIAGDVFTLRARADEPRKPHLPVDIFLRSLAATCGSRAIGVILSGTASDGTEGLRAIQAENGLTLAQDPRSAKFGGMPQSAVQAGVVDACLPLPQLAQELVWLGRHPYTTLRAKKRGKAPHEPGTLERLFSLVRNAVGVDFSEYRPATFERRLARRMALRRAEDLQGYVKVLEQNPDEARALYEDVLIHVTSFFRDPEDFEALKKEVFPTILQRKPAGAPFRIWAAGCSTGEEVYSLAICLLEFLGALPSRPPIQIFGSDISEQAIEKARAGLYPDSALLELSAERRARYFSQVDGHYRITKAVRELCVFVRHDLARDPPFSKLDLVVCRNVLIYFTPALQKRVLATFHYCLNSPGFLMIGGTESVSGVGHLFSPLDKGHKLLARTSAPSQLRFAQAAELSPSRKPVRDDTSSEPALSPGDPLKRVDRLLLNRYAPPGVVITEKMEILQFRGHTGPYLEPAAGAPQFNLLKMAREGLLAPLRLALAQTKKQSGPVRMNGVQVGQLGSRQRCDLVVLPVTSRPEEQEHLYLVLFEEEDRSVKRGEKPVRGSAPPKERARQTRRAPELALELAATKDYLQSLIEEHAHANEALAAANEELISSNEELQSMNEELETAKEELQSTNEELTTVNDELHNSNEELNQANSDLLNLLNTVDIPILILDLERRIRRFTPRARDILNVLPSDVGRPLQDIALNIGVEDLDHQVAEAIETALVRETEVQDRAGRWHRMQIRPYTTADNRINGALLSLVDIDALKHNVSQAEWARDYATGIVEAVQVPLMVLDETLSVISANRAFYQTYGVSAAETEKQSLFALSGGAWDAPELRAALGEMLARNTHLQGLELEHAFPHRGTRRMSLSARSVHSRTGVPMLLLAIEDITERKQRELERAELLAHTRQAKEEAERANRAKDEFLATLSHELRTPLSTMLMQAQLLRRAPMDKARLERAGETIERSIQTQVQLIDDLLDVSRIIAGKLRVQFQPTHLPAVVQAALESVSAQAERKSITFQVALDESLGPISGDPTRLQQIVWNLLSNAIKFSPADQQVSVVLEGRDGQALLRVSDRGSGIEAKGLPRIFDRFMQEDSSSTRMFGGLGLGLSIVRHLVELHGGTVRAESPGKGQGATFTVLLPLMPVRPDAAAAVNPPSKEHTRAARPPGTAAAGPRLEGARVLVVDDDEGAREAVTELLRQEGADARAAFSAASGLALIEDFQPEVLLCDIAMPGEDGYAFIRKVRALGAKRGGEVPAIALTALVSDTDRRQALGAGFQQHMAKPIDSERLVEAVAEAWKSAAASTTWRERPSDAPDEEPPSPVP